MRPIDADILCPDCLTKQGKLAISQSQIAEAPTVERPTGEWVRDDYAGIHCSECDYFPLKDVVIKIYADGSKVKSGSYNLTPYCPNCGLRMKKETEDE